MPSSRRTFSRANSSPPAAGRPSFESSLCSDSYTHVRALLTSDSSELPLTGFQPWHSSSLALRFVFPIKNGLQPSGTRSCTPVAVFIKARCVSNAQPAVQFVESSSPAVYSCTDTRSASARVCAAVMSQSDTVRGRGELNATSKG